ncbi:MAG: sulfatase-like hydrolase/transferase [Acidobacteria bacterium]|nr:sulfatase-like hydrolase/transferase [Acidobacteriota bacterium]
MTRRHLLAGLGAGASGVGQTRGQRPNVVLILADDLGSADLSCYGSADIRTPNIDSIGAKGVRFTQFYATAECTPTRCSLLTGRYPQRVGGLECAIGVGENGRYDEAIWLQKRGELGLPASELTLAQLLKRSGYETGCFGKWHLGYREQFSANRHGFDEYFGILGGGADYFKHEETNEGAGQSYLYHNSTKVKREGYLTDLFAGAALDWLKRKREKPFLLYLPFNAPHAPIQDPDGFDAAAGTAPVRQGHRATYRKMAERMDQRVGDILAQLESMGAAANTLVIFLSDNGADANGSNVPLRGRKSSLWEGGIRVPCLMRWPSVLPGGRTVSQVGAAIDLLPTILAAARTEVPKGHRLDGINLLPTLTAERAPQARRLFWRYRRGKAIRKAIRDGDMKYVFDSGSEELHDLSQDGREQQDLLASRSQVARDLKAKLQAWEQEVRAPRLRLFKPDAA